MVATGGQQWEGQEGGLAVDWAERERGTSESSPGTRATECGVMRSQA